MGKGENENDLSGRVGLDITDFKTNAAELNRQIKVIDSGFKAAAAGMEYWGKTEEGVKGKMKALTDIIALQKQKVENLTAEYKKVAAEKGESSKAAQDMQIKLNKETEALNKNQLELKKATEKLDAFGKESDDAADKAKGLETATDGLNQKMASIGGAVGKAAIAGVAAVGAAFVGMGAAAIGNADELQRQSDVTGLTAERLQELQYVGSNLGVELDTLTGAQAKVTKSMFAAKDGTGAQAAAYKALGVDVVDSNGKLRDSKTVMAEVITALGKKTNSTERDALAMQIMGKSAMDLNPLIKAGGDEINKMTQEARDNGAVMSNEAVAGLDSFGDTVDNLKTTVLGNFGEKFNEMLPAIQGFLGNLQEMPQWIDENSNKLIILGVGVGTITALVIAFNIQQTIANATTGIWAVVAGTATLSTTTLGAAFAFLTSPITLVILAIGAVIAIGVLLYKNWDTIMAWAGKLGATVKTKFTSIKTSITDNIDAAKEGVKSGIDKMKSFFSFKWSLPKIKLPHFKISGSFSLSPPKVPKFGVSWYKEGGIFTGPSIIGVGEAGTEAVIPIDKLSGIVEKALKQTMTGLKLQVETSQAIQTNISQSGSGDTYIEVPLSMDGQVITRATSRIQHGRNNTRARSLGVVPS